MAAIPETKIDEVRNAVNIVDYIGQFVSLHKAGQNMFGLCPFQDEKTPSFSVNESKQIFHCFSCGRGGNVFKFVMEYDHLAFPQAVAKVADYAGIELGVDLDANRPVEDPAKVAQKALLKQTQDFYHHILVNAESGSEALAYLHKRGLDDATIEHFNIGFAPVDGTLLRSFVTAHGFDYDVQRKSGMFAENQDGTLHDRFIDRVMFPLTDINGDVIGFSGRMLHKPSGGRTIGKYVNSPETDLFAKREVLFNLGPAKNDFKQSPPILFEGFMDVIAAYQAGVTTGIASMGTSLTEEQVGIIAHQSREMVLCYDGDEPGQHATGRALDLIERHSRLKVSVVVLPDGQDPDEFIQSRGKEAFQQQMTQTITPLGFRLHALAAGKQLTTDQEKLDYIHDALALVAREPDSVAQSVYLSQVAKLTGVNEADLKTSMPAPTPVAPGLPTAGDEFGPEPPADEEDPGPGGFGGYGSGGSGFGAAGSGSGDFGQRGSGSTAPAQVMRPHYDRFEKAERLLLVLSWRDPEIATRLHQTDFVFPDAPYQTLFDAWLNFAHENEDGAIAGFLDQVPEDLMATATDLAMMTPPESTDEEVDGLIAQIGEKSIRDRLAALKVEMTQAQQLGDKQTSLTLSQQYIELMRTLKARPSV
ncbi:DNA primase [Lacticaseibacillus yichunensis]|uniref:DNA primase n=1 Tax=Lacticaseibacillus yichunensis TaxID=2486015 RepID=A0ABW4CPL1_9LACO|nr:DNA primase [Lacticaseibacillus yichunensis]